IGDSATLRCCVYKQAFIRINFFMQPNGKQPQIIITVYKSGGETIYNGFKKSRFQTERSSDCFSLTILNIIQSDEAVYYCALTSPNIVFGDGTYVKVRDVKVTVLQSSVSDSVPAGASVTLQCSVLSESRAAELQVLWFRAAPSQSHPQLIYTHHNSSLQCESSTHTCVYNLSMNIFSLDDTGTYYCAVALCGKIIFGNGTVVQFGKEK
ncbi:putative immune-type receptor 13 isoform 1 precursor, partial [Silurus meridionalis]